VSKRSITKIQLDRKCVFDLQGELTREYSGDSGETSLNPRPERSDMRSADAEIEIHVATRMAAKYARNHIMHNDAETGLRQCHSIKLYTENDGESLTKWSGTTSERSPVRRVFSKASVGEADRNLVFCDMCIPLRSIKSHVTRSKPQEVSLVTFYFRNSMVCILIFSGGPDVREPSA